jgi:hypothetical protein
VKIVHIDFCAPCKLLVEELCSILGVLLLGDNDCFLISITWFVILGPCLCEQLGMSSFNYSILYQLTEVGEVHCSNNIAVDMLL